jgi:CRP-like cAMP-binding protein
MKTKFSSINLLTKLQQEDYVRLCSDFTEKHYQKGCLIYGPGHDDNLVFIIKKGKVRIYLAMEDKEFSLTILEPGDIYVTHSRAHVAAIEDVTLLTMPTMRFHSYMVDHPALSRTIISILGELLKQSFSIIDNLVFKDISGRLADFFLHEAEHSGWRMQEGILLHLDLTMEQLAAIIGSSRQTVSTILNSMQRAGVLRKQERGVYLIANLDLLRNFPSL